MNIAPILPVVILLFAGLTTDYLAAEEPTKTEWGQISSVEGDVGTFRLTVTSPPANGKLNLPTPFANITSAYYADDFDRAPIITEFNNDATQIAFLIDHTEKVRATFDILLETAEKTKQFADGRIVLSALDAKVNGSRAKLETHPGNHRIGFWTNDSDTVSWNYNATRPGMYEVELTYSGDGNEGTEIEIEIGDAKVTGKLRATGSYYRYTTLPLGEMQLDKSQGSYPVTVRCMKKTGGAVMNLKAITLRPTCEGEPPTQAEDGSIVLDAKDVTIRGVQVRWEPQPNKRCVGYWANANDFVSWEFEVDRPGKFDVEISQGCGKGHGGSEVDVSVGDQPLQFTVKDTGHFQNFVDHKIGQVTIDQPGWHQLVIRPQKKARAAVMDVRRVRLSPVSEK